MIILQFFGRLVYVKYVYFKMLLEKCKSFERKSDGENCQKDLLKVQRNVEQHA